MARDAFGLLSALGAQPNLLSEISNDVRRAAEMLIRKQLKSDAFGLAQARALHDAIGGAAFAAAVAGLSRTAASEIVKRFDPHNPQARRAVRVIDDRWARARVLALSSGGARPMPARSAAMSDGTAPRPAPSPAELAAALRDARAPDPAGPRREETASGGGARARSA